MASGNYEPSHSHSHPSSDRRTLASDDNPQQRERYSPPSSIRRSASHEHRGIRSPPRAPAAMELPQYKRGRRDYDNDSSEAYSSKHYRRTPPRDYSRQTYRDRDREGYRSPRYQSRSRSRSRGSPRRRDRDNSPPYRGNPSREIIMEGIPVDMTEKDIRTELEDHYHAVGLSDVRIIHDRKTGVSRQFGFLEFSDIEVATTFLDQVYPSIRLYGRSNESTTINVAYSRDDRGHDGRNKSRDITWVCGNCSLPNFDRRQFCFRCQASRAEYSLGPPVEQPKQANTGDSDASLDFTPSQFLLLRGLEPSVSEEMLAKGVTKLYKVSESQIAESAKKPGAKVSSTTSSSNFGAQEGSIKRVFVVRDRRSDDSWRYGFAEFHSVEDAQAALARFQALDRFTIASKPVLVSYIHAGVFVPAISSHEDERFSFSATSNPSVRLTYWDQNAYLRELVVSETPPANSLSTMEQTSKSTPQPNIDGAATNKDSDGKSKKRKAESNIPSANKKAIPSHLQFWKDRHAELHGVENKSSVDVDGQEGTDSAPELKEQQQQQPVQSYSDITRKCCYLCSRQFKTEAEVNKHERLSELHRTNLNNEQLKTKALAKLAKARMGAKPGSSGEASLDTAEYRDRAKERRSAYGQPKKPKGGTGSNNNKTPGSKKSAAGGNDPEEDGDGVDDGDTDKPKPSKGASLLGKMGWSEGQGLGREGTGMVAPIATELYAQGVGLGMVGGKLGDAVDEAERRTKGGYEAFLEKAREGARERFESMKD